MEVKEILWFQGARINHQDQHISNLFPASLNAVEARKQARKICIRFYSKNPCTRINEDC